MLAWAIAAFFVIVLAINLFAIAMDFSELAQLTAKIFADLIGIIPNVTTLGIALVATIAFFPYIYNIYPVPHRTEYYVGILRSPWLPAEKISLRNGSNYYGYTLSADQDWFTVLLARTRKIVYVRTDEVVRRSVCETLSQRKVPVEPPLITTFYRRPATIRPCADRKFLVKSKRSATATKTRSRGRVPTVPHGHTLPPP